MIYTTGLLAHAKSYREAVRYCWSLRICGHCFVTQWLASRQRLTVLEELQAQRVAA